jgi:hypothetical protein
MLKNENKTAFVCIGLVVSVFWSVPAMILVLGMWGTYLVLIN